MAALSLAENSAALKLKGTPRLGHAPGRWPLRCPAVPVASNSSNDTEENHHCENTNIKNMITASNHNSNDIHGTTITNSSNIVTVIKIMSPRCKYF